MASVEGKRKRSVVTLETKLKIIVELEKDRSHRLVLEQFKVAKSMISDRSIWKDRERNTCLCVLTRQSLRSALLSSRTSV